MSPTLKRNQTKDSSLKLESQVAAQLGLTRVMCAALRREHLKPEVDYVIERRRVMITESGYVALRSLLGCPESPEEEKARLRQPVREPEVISLVITSLRPPKNPHIIEATRKDDGGNPQGPRAQQRQLYAWDGDSRPPGRKLSRCLCACWAHAEV
jgi:hypothetical protein